MWRFWRELPPKGKIGIMFGSWYTAPIVSRVLGQSDDAALKGSLEEIVRFEKMLCDEGVLLLKFWFHLSKKQQKKRMQELEKDPLTRWRVTKLDWERFKMYDAFRQMSERALRETSNANAPWTVVEGVDPRYRSLTVGKMLLEAMKKRLEKTQLQGAPRAGAAAAGDGQPRAAARPRHDAEARQGKVRDAAGEMAGPAERCCRATGSISGSTR